MPLLWLLERRRLHTWFGGPLAIHRYRPARKDVLGGMVFGTGWAVAGACPGTVIAMVAGGSLLGFVVMAGLFAGLLLRDVVARQTATRVQAVEVPPLTARP
jgi:uncharacterized protein